MKIKWQNPPEPTVRGRGRPHERPLLSSQLEQHPGRWALIYRSVASSQITRLRKDVAPNGVLENCELRVISLGKRTGKRGGKLAYRFDVYIRWNDQSKEA